MQKDRYLQKILEQLNSGKTINSYLVARKLSEQVQLTRIWSSDENENPTDIYLLKEKDNYIGAVLEQETELYAYMVTPSRRKSHMETALKETILPHLLQRTPILRVTISRSLLSEKMYLAGKHLATAAGFEILREENGQCKLLLDGTKLQNRIFAQGENTPLSPEEKEKVRNLVRRSALYLSVAQCMLEYREGRSPLSEDLLETQRQLCFLMEKVLS